MPKKTRHTILVGGDIGYSYGRGVLLGIAGRSRHLGNWQLVFYPRGPSIIEQAEQYHPGGVIAQIGNPEAIRRMAEMEIPVVNVSTRTLDKTLDVVASDGVKIAQLAVNHFLERGFTNFAYFGQPGHGYSINRQNAFAATLGRAGFTCALCPEKKAFEPAKIAEWLRALPKPVAIMACNDPRAAEVVEACMLGNIAVPEEVAVLGVDNDEVVCETSPVRLSSIDVDSFEIGVQAAALMERMLSRGISSRKTSKRELIEIAPLAVVGRRSTETIAFQDLLVADCMRIFQNNTDQPISIKEVLEKLKVSRRTLERRFLAAVGRSPHRQLERRRFEQARHLLETTDMQVNKISLRAGFTDVRRLIAAFRRELGVTPMEHRQRSARQHSKRGL